MDTSAKAAAEKWERERGYSGDGAVRGRTDGVEDEDVGEPLDERGGDRVGEGDALHAVEVEQLLEICEAMAGGQNGRSGAGAALCPRPLVRLTDLVAKSR